MYRSLSFKDVTLDQSETTLVFFVITVRCKRIGKRVVYDFC